MSASALLDEGISGQGNRAKEYFPSDTYPTQSSSPSWWEKTNWFRTHSQQPSNQPPLPAVSPAALAAAQPASGPAAADEAPSGQLRRRYFHHHADVVEYGGVGGEVEAAYRSHILKADAATAADGSIADAPGHAVCFNRFLTSRTPTAVGAPPIATASAPANQVLPLANTAATIKSTTGQRRPTRRQVLVQASQGYSRSVCQQLQEYILLPLLQPAMFARLGITASRGVLLTGQSGSGKSRLIEAMVDQLGIYFHSLNGANIAAGDGSGATAPTATIESESNQQTVIDRVFKAARKHAPAIIFIDDIDAITPTRTPSDSPLLIKLRASLRHNIDALASNPPPHPVLVVGACTAASELCPSLLRHGRFDRMVVLSKPDAAGRRRMLDELVKGMVVDGGVELDEVAKRTEGYVGSDLMALCREAGMECVRAAMREQRRTDREEMAEAEDDAGMEDDDAYSMPRTLSPTLLSSLAVKQSHFLSALTLIKPAAARSFAADIAPMSWSALGGHDTIKTTLNEAISLPISHSSLFRHFNLSSSSSTLLYGPSGCGKTALARCVASTYGLSFVSVKGPELLKSYLGESEKAVRDLFGKARAASPCVLFLDEVDAIATRRGMGNDATVDRVINQLLIEMDGAHTHSQSSSSASSSSSAPAPPLLFLLAATNRPELLDPAMLRPGRFDQLLYVPLPTTEDRADIVAACLRDTPVGSDVLDEERVRGWAERMAGYSGADIAGVLNGARRLAVRDELSRRSAASVDDKTAAAVDSVVTVQHVEQSLAGSRASVDETDLARYDYFQRVTSRTGENRRGQADSDDEDDDMQDEKSDEDGSAQEEEEKKLTAGDESDEKEEEKDGARAATSKRPIGDLERIRRRVRAAVAREMGAGSNPQQALNNVLRRFNTGTGKGEGKRRVATDQGVGEDVKENDEMMGVQDRRPRRPISGMTAM